MGCAAFSHSVGVKTHKHQLCFTQSRGLVRAVNKKKEMFGVFVSIDVMAMQIAKTDLLG